VREFTNLVPSVAGARSQPDLRAFCATANPLVVRRNTWALSWLKYNLPDDQKSNFNAFEADYASYLTNNRNRLEEQHMQPFATTADAEVTRTRAALLFLVKYGIGSDDQAVTNLGRWLEDPLNLPNGTRYMKAMLEQGATPTDLRNYNAKMIGDGRNTGPGCCRN
jgi:hypothetical protein